MVMPSWHLREGVCYFLSFSIFAVREGCEEDRCFFFIAETGRAGGLSTIPSDLCKSRV